MNKQRNVWQLIVSGLQQRIPVMLLYVLESKGSSPGRPGFCMAITVNGDMAGSIGGGIMEHKFVEMVKEQLQQDVQESTIRKQLHNKTAPKNQSGMICSGEQTILLYRVQDDDAATIDRIIHSLDQRQNGLLRLSPAGLQFEDTPPANDFTFRMQSEGEWLYEEKTGYKNRLYIIGGGHCSLALSELMYKMDFYVHVFDDRNALHTLAQNEFAHQKTIVDSYEELQALVPAGNNHYVIIMTFGYRTDDIALRALWKKSFRYLAVLGSQHKIAEMFNSYKLEGIPPERLRNIHAPAGIAIKSQTPEEIAVSIAAEIIREKNGQQKIDHKEG
jgi:xanthine dehydrogenase accessory factor